jgi:hypothetical protein
MSGMDYHVNTDELRRASSQLVSKANEMRAAVSAVDSAMAPARAMSAPVVASNIQNWDALKAKLQQAFEQAEAASRLITTTASNIDNVMNQKISGG